MATDIKKQAGSIDSALRGPGDRCVPFGCALSFKGSFLAVSLGCCPSPAGVSWAPDSSLGDGYRFLLYGHMLFTTVLETV